MEDVAQLETEDAPTYRAALKIPTLSPRGAPPLAAAKAIDKMSVNYQAGYAAGAAECAGRLDAEKSRLAAVGAGLKNSLHGVDERCRGECTALIMQVFTALAPSIARRSVRAEIQEIVQNYAMRKKQPITIRMHPALADDLAMEDADDVSDTAKITIEADDQLNPNAVDISWANGGMFYDPDALIAEISGVFANEDKPNEE